jgi:CPA2 family monovalent cation:H+ antiporter-2
MPHHSSLIVMLVAALGLAFFFGAVAFRLRLSPLVGYLVAGVVIGPFTPGYVADQALAPQLAEIGIILLMFGVGLHFSLSDLLAVRTIAIPGAVGQIVLVTLLGWGLATLLGWPVGGGVIFGLALSVASTVVVLRVLQERRMIETERGKIAVGWLVVEDLVTVLALVLLPAFSGLFGGKPVTTTAPTGLMAWFEPSSIGATLALTVIKVGAFVAVMLLVGRRIIPWVLHWVAHTGSRELFRLCVLVIALGVALGSAELFDVSFALGAFFAGMILAESTLSQQAASETLPLRDAFAVLFFVSVGMLFDPLILVRHPYAVLATLLIIVVGNATAAFLIVKLWRYDLRTALTLGISLSQIGEFSFILAGLGLDLGLLPEMGRDLILAGALLSIVVNPLLFFALEHFGKRLPGWEPRPAESAGPDQQAPQDADPYQTTLTGHAVLVGYGRVGSLVGEALIAKGQKMLVIEERHEVIAALHERGIEAIAGNAALPGLLKAANIAEARWLISAIPNPFENANLVEHGRSANHDLEIIARAHSDAEVEYLRKYGADFIIVGETEIARGIVHHIDARLDQDDVKPNRFDA